MSRGRLPAAVRHAAGPRLPIAFGLVGTPVGWLAPRVVGYGFDELAQTTALDQLALTQ